MSDAVESRGGDAASQGGRLEVLIWRMWEPRYEYPLTMSALAHHGVGGTEMQMLWHARHLSQLGHRVQVLGTSDRDLSEEGIDFVGARNRAEQEARMSAGDVRPPAVVFMEGSFEAAPLLRSRYPAAKIVHVGQNIDAGGDRAAFAMEQFIDVYALVGPGQYADYCTRWWSLRHKFMLLRNAVPWEWIYRDVTPRPLRDHVMWVGSWWKKGLRQWAEVMQRVLAEFPTLHWTLCGPSYGPVAGAMPTDVSAALKTLEGRASVRTLPLRELVEEISTARVVLVSLGNECGPGSVLDAHAMGRPVISGNDVVYKYSNPDGTGVRATTADECYRALVHLLRNPQLCDRLGASGRRLISEQFTERHQREDLQAILEYLAVKDALGPAGAFVATSHAAQRRTDLRDKVVRKWNTLRRRG